MTTRDSHKGSDSQHRLSDQISANTVQVSSIRAALPQHPCRRPQHVQSSTTTRLSVHPADLPSRSSGAVAECCRMKPDSSKPHSRPATVAVTRPCSQWAWAEQQSGRKLMRQSPGPTGYRGGLRSVTFRQRRGSQLVNPDIHPKINPFRAIPSAGTAEPTVTGSRLLGRGPLFST